MKNFKQKLLEKYPFLNYIFSFNYGLLKDKEDERDYQLGDGQIKHKQIIRQDGQWKEFLPAEERQAGRRVDTMACCSFGLLNCIETLAKAQFSAIWNKSDRYLATVSNTTRNGNSMRKVLDTTRKYFGTLKEKHWTWNKNTFTWNEYYKAVPRNLQEMGKAWLKEYELKYENVYNNKNLLMEALKYSPLYVGGYAWYKKNGLYQSYGRANHCFIIFGYVKGSHWKIFDSYKPFLKKLSWDYNFQYVKSIYLQKKSLQYDIQKIKALQKRGFKYVMRVLGEGQVYELKDDKLVKIEPQKIKDMAIINLAKDQKLIGINEEFYSRLIR